MDNYDDKWLSDLTEQDFDALSYRDKNKVFLLMQQYAFTNRLTGLPNRRKFDAELAAILREAERAPVGCYRGFAVVYIDLDAFKERNDTHGHLSGDKLLKEVAATLKRTLWKHKNDVIARIGGDEFAVLLRDLTQEDAEMVTNRLRDELQHGNIRASIGAIFCPPVLVVEPKDVVKAADMLMYQAKALERERHSFVFVKFGVYSPV